VTAAESSDGTTWSDFRTITFTSLLSTVYVGLVSVSTGGTQAVFDNVSIQ
jgi:hypothetical protein